MEPVPDAEDGSDRPRLGSSQAGRPRARQRVEASLPGRLWTRLDAMDFVNRGMLFAAVLFLCLIPFLIVVGALAGRDSATGVIRRFGLDPAASAAVAGVFTAPASTSNALSGLSWVFFVLGGIAAAGALQGLYEACFELEGRGLRDTWRRISWLAVFVGVLALAGSVSPRLHASGGPALLAALAFPVLVLFWWFTIWFLLSGRRTWRAVFPSALATSVCWLAMVIVFHLIMSSTITDDYRKYGAIGVIFALMSFLIAIGVVVILGAVVGVVWQERRRPTGDATGGPTTT